MKPVRLTWIDYAKGIAIILVLYRHVFEGIKTSKISVQQFMPLEYANIMLFSFRMPLFFIVSGIFVVSSLRKRGLTDFINVKIRTILYPYLLWGALQITLQLIFSKFVNIQRTSSDYLYLLYQPRAVEQFWYLYALFNVTVLYVLAKVKLGITPVQNILIGIILLFMSSVVFKAHLDIGFLQDILHFYFFFAVGDAISHLINDKKYFSYFESWKILGLLFIPFVMSQAYFLKQCIFYEKQYGDIRYSYFEFYQPFPYILIAFIGCAFIISVSFILQKYRAVNWLQVLGRHSLYIYVSHVIVFASLRILMTKLLGIYNVPILLITGIISGLIIPVALYQLSVRLNIRWLFTLQKNTPVIKIAHINSPVVQ